MQATVIVCLFIAVDLPLCLAQEHVAELGVQTTSKATPIGRWKTMDDTSGQAKSIVVIWQDDGRLFGRIDKLLDQNPVDPNPRCVRCDGDSKYRPLIGLTILWGLQKSGEQWSGGKILDPDNGKIYKCSIALEGKKLKVRGFIGFSLIGRTQYWFPAD